MKIQEPEHNIKFNNENKRVIEEKSCLIIKGI